MSIDVMIGNWIDTPRGIEKVYKIEVDAINGVAWPYCKPIPLSPEILEKCGFEEKDNHKNFQFKVYTKDDFTFNTNHGWWYFNRNLDRQPKYLHQLQNLYYALTQNELTITL